MAIQEQKQTRTQFKDRVSIVDADFHLRMIGGNPIVAMGANDYILYDRTNDRYKFYIGGTCRFYIDTTGGHDGAPP